MLYTDKEILEAIREARMNVCDIIFALIDSPRTDPQMRQVTDMLNALNDQLRAAAAMCRANIRKCFPEAL